MIRLSLVGLVLGCSFAHAGVIYVNKSAAPGGDGQSWATAYNELEHGLAAATSGDEIWITQGVYTPDIGPNASDREFPCTQSPSGEDLFDISRTRTFLLPDGVSLYGGFLGSENAVLERTLDNTATVLSGDVGELKNVAQVLITDPVTPSSILIDTLTIRDGQAEVIASIFVTVISDFASGGGLFIQGDNVTLHNVHFDQNFAYDAGSAVCSTGGGSLVVTQSVFTNNTLSDDHSFDDCLFIPEGFRAGGAIYYEAAFGQPNSLSVVNTNFSYNNCTDRKGGAAVFVESGNADFDGCTFENNTGGGEVPSGGQSVGQHASALQGNDNVTINNCVFTQNIGGSAVYLGNPLNFEPKTYSVTNSSFYGNRAVFLTSGSPIYYQGGGAISVFTGGATISNCVFENNSSGSYAGAVSAGIGMTIVDSVFKLNVAGGSEFASGDGGALYGRPAVLSRCTFEDNSASTSSFSGRGGAIWSDAGSFEWVVDDCLFYGNSAKEGGAIYLAGGASITSIINSTITQNSASIQAGGIANRLGSPSFANSIIWGNTAPGSTLDAQIKDLGLGSAMVNYTCIEDPASSYGGVGMVYSDPQFLDPVNGDFRLRSNTPCRDVGDNSALDTNNDGILDILLDLDTRNRLQGDVDFGAYERCFGDYNSDGDLNFLDISLFLSDYGQGNLNADLTHDGLLNFLDVSEFLTLHGAGCN